ncbi:molybdopterin oxidoreductase [Desulfovibrio sp. X2]|uniref:molybdopterin dinucleotide binding domain-containing protein n=1 Tax=Desulfovibrio sp. X2 TaxID=941449 RepID=UPI000358962C|nr:molybdopterin dinucleotide binding domain-containing protein [Desulfovibrio sp. X2]EPR44543.1 molybdopterin oxidoreductase [Desulfovibrio sp. X2]
MSTKKNTAHDANGKDAMDRTKRNLLKKGAAAAGLGVFAAAAAGAGMRLVNGLSRGTSGETVADPVAKNALRPEYTASPDGGVALGEGRRVAFNQCWGCTTFCGVRLHIDEATDTVVRVAGNPYNPLSQERHFPMSMPVAETLARLSAVKDAGQAGRSTVCGRGAAMIDAIDNPFRITHCLKRVGKRGEGKWTRIPFEQLVAEVVEGGDLFGEGHVDGLRAIREAKGPANPEMPEFGPQQNRLLLTYAVDDGRSEFFFKRFGMQSFGTKSFGKHGAYCGLSFRIGSGLFMDDLKGYKHIKPDFENCEFALFWGTAPSQAGNPYKRSARFLASRRTDGKLRYAVVDPVLRMPASSAARERARWVPIRPGMDSALAMAMMRWIFANERYDENFLSRPTLQAAEAAGEAGFCNATHLVQLTGKGAGRLLRAADLGLASAAKPQAAPGAKPDDDADDSPVVMVVAQGGPDDGRLVPAARCGRAALFYRGEVKLPGGESVEVATALQLLREEADGRETEEYAALCGVPVETIEALARELTAHGKRAAVDVHGGMMSTSGMNATFTVLTLNTLIGNINAKGGISATAGNFHGPAAKGPRYDLSSFPGEVQAKGFPAIRCRAPYQKSTEFKKKVAAGRNPYPSEYPWYPLTPPNMPAEHLLAHANGSPFTYKCWINWTGNVLYGHGGLKRAVKKHLADPKSLPLIVGIDTFHNETNAFADYLVPDPCMYEVWGGFSGAWSGVLTKMSTARWPAIAPRQEKAASGEPVSMELFLIEAARRMGLPGFGDNAIPGADGALHPLNTPQDYYLRLAANVAWFKGEVLPAPSDEDVKLSGISRILPDIARVLPAEERGPVACIYSRGGRFAPYGASYEGERLKARWRRPLQIYNEDAGTAVNSQTGKRYSGTACFKEPLLTDGRPLRAVWSEKDYPLLMTSFKSNLINSYSVISRRLLTIKPVNMVMLHESDAKRLGVSHGDLVRIVSPAASAEARVVVGDVVMPGVIAVEHGFGHTALGAQDVTVDGRTIRAERAAASGFSLNDLVPSDPTRKGASTLVEHESGCSARQGIPVRVEKI